MASRALTWAGSSPSGSALRARRTSSIRARTASWPAGAPARVVSRPAPTSRSWTSHWAGGATARSSTCTRPREIVRRSTEKVHRPGAAGAGGGATGTSRSEKLNSASPVRTIRTAGSARAISTSRISRRNSAGSETVRSSRSNAAKGSGPSRSASRKPLTARRPVNRLRSMSSMATARPVRFGIWASATRRTISGRAHRKAPPSTTRAAATTSATLRRRRIFLSVLRGPGPSPGPVLPACHTNDARDTPGHLSRAGGGGYNGFARVEPAGRRSTHGTATARAPAPRRVSHPGHPEDGRVLHQAPEHEAGRPRPERDGPQHARALSPPPHLPPDGGRRLRGLLRDPGAARPGGSDRGAGLGPPPGAAGARPGRPAPLPDPARNGRGEGAGSGGPRLLPLHLLLRPERHPAGADVRHSRLRARGRGGRRRGRQGLEPPHGPPGDRRPLAGRPGERSAAMVRTRAVVLLVAAGLGALLASPGRT